MKKQVGLGAPRPEGPSDEMRKGEEELNERERERDLWSVADASSEREPLSLSRLSRRDLNI